MTSGFRAWTKSREGHIVAAGAVVVALMTADVLADGLLVSLDRAVHDATVPAGAAPSWTGPVGRFGEVPVTGALLIAVALVSMQVLWRWWPGILAAANLAVLGIVVGGLKWPIARTGPDGTQAEGGQLGYFPSGHTATSAICIGTTIFLLLACHTRGRQLARAQRAAVLVGMAAGIAVGSAAVLGGYHWLSDVVASLVISAVVVQVGISICRRYVEQSSDVPQRV